MRILAQNRTGTKADICMNLQLMSVTDKDLNSHPTIEKRTRKWRNHIVGKIFLIAKKKEEKEEILATHIYKKQTEAIILLKKLKSCKT